MSKKQDRSYNGIDTWFIQDESINNKVILEVYTVTICARTIIKSNLLHLCSFLLKWRKYQNLLKGFIVEKN